MKQVVSAIEAIEALHAQLGRGCINGTCPVDVLRLYSYELESVVMGSAGLDRAEDCIPGRAVGQGPRCKYDTIQHR